MAEPTVSAGVARGLIAVAAARGADAAVLATRTGIDPRDLEDQDNRIPFDRYVVLMRTAKAMTGDPALALHYAEEVSIAQFSVVGLVTEASETMFEAFVQINRYGRLVVEVDGLGDGDRFTLQREADGLWLTDHRINPDAFPELTEATFARMVCGSRQFDQDPFVTCVEVTYPAPPHAAEYERIFRVPVRFGMPRNAIRLHERWMTYRLNKAPRYAFGILTRHADALLEGLDSSRSMRGRVESLLLPILHTGETGIERIAGRLNMSRQTLFRRLRAEDTAFERVLDDLRRRMAMHYLAGRKVSVNETAYLLGFSDPAAFSRAFKRWTGQSPRSVRLAEEVVAAEVFQG